MSANTVLKQLVDMSRHLGDPAYDYAILGEGNTSARIDAESFWVKASGAELRTIDAGGFVQIHFDRVLSMLEFEELPDAQIKDGLNAARVDPKAGARPSVETVLHALILQLGNRYEGAAVDFVGHTHPTAVNAILCSQKAEEAVAGRLFPDEIVYCGPSPVYIPYIDPGLPLARAVRDGIDSYLDEHHETPKVILLQNHGLFALGKSASEVENITAMYVKTARVILGAYALGGPRFMTPQAVDRIHTRPDELFRRQEWDEQ